ncbi:MAG TPA: helix-turn-helix domain-containing protein [Acidimicrobiia bacterium]
MTTGDLIVDRHDDGDTAWELARRRPPAALGASTRGYCGYEERSLAPVRRREVPHGGIVLILSFGDAIDVTTAAGTSARPQRLRSFVAGLHDAPVITHYEGRQHGVQIDLTPAGAYRVFGLPLRELANRSVALDEVRGREIEELVARLAEERGGWGARFEIVDRVLGKWLADGPDPDRPVTWAWNQLERSNGGVAVADLADEIGWSRRHFASRFRDQIGLAPKPTARVLRFRRAVDLLGDASVATIGDVAAAAGYADHSHLVRDFRALAGCSPSELVAARMPDGGGVAA